MLLKKKIKNHKTNHNNKLSVSIIYFFNYSFFVSAKPKGKRKLRVYRENFRMEMQVTGKYVRT